MSNRKIDRLLDCPQGGDLECGVRFADWIGQRSTIELRVDVGDVVIDGQVGNYPFESIAAAYALVVLARRLAEIMGLTAADLAAGVGVRTPSGTPIEIRNADLGERSAWAARILRGARGLSLRRADADLIASIVDALAQRAGQPVRRAAA